MGPEARLARWFNDHLPATWHAQRIETTTGRGVPDTNVCAGLHNEFWIEFKRRHQTS